MFGSDWPVCLLAAPYERVLEACRAALGEISPSDRDAIFGGNAVRLYRLAVPATVTTGG
jgi:L-fuconolactonase